MSLSRHNQGEHATRPIKWWQCKQAFTLIRHELETQGLQSELRRGLVRPLLNQYNPEKRLFLGLCSRVRPAAPAAGDQVLQAFPRFADVGDRRGIRAGARFASVLFEFGPQTSKSRGAWPLGLVVCSPRSTIGLSRF